MDPAEAAPAAVDRPARREKLAALLVAGVALPLLLWLGARALDRTAELASPGEVDPARRTYEQFECIEDALRRLPGGARIVVDEEHDLWEQRLAELASPHLEVTERPEAATHRVSVEEGEGPGSCAGMELVAHPLP